MLCRCGPCGRRLAAGAGGWAAYAIAQCRDLSPISSQTMLLAMLRRPLPSIAGTHAAVLHNLAVCLTCSNPPELVTREAFPRPREDGSSKTVVSYSGEKFDVFSAGCMLHKLLTGHPPPASCLYGWPERFRGGTYLPEEVQSLLAGMCATEPADRFTAAGALAHRFFTGVNVPAALWPPNIAVPQAAAGAPIVGISRGPPVDAAAAAVAAAPGIAAPAVGGAGAGGAVGGAGAAP